MILTFFSPVKKLYPIQVKTALTAQLFLKIICAEPENTASAQEIKSIGTE